MRRLGPLAGGGVPAPGRPPSSAPRLPRATGPAGAPSTGCVRHPVLPRPRPMKPAGARSCLHFLEPCARDALGHRPPVHPLYAG